METSRIILTNFFSMDVAGFFNPTTAPYLVCVFVLVYCLNLIELTGIDYAKELATYLGKVSARVKSVRPGKATIEYINDVKNSAR